MLSYAAWRKIYAAGFVIYALGIGIYLWLSSQHPIPDMLRGTAGDPSTFMEVGKAAQSVVYSAFRNGIFFISYPWEWGIYLFLLFSGRAARLQERLDQRLRPGWLRLPVYVLFLQAIVFAAFLPIRVLSFSLSKTYGISTQAWGGWLRDRMVDFGIGYLLLTCVAAVAFWIIGKGGRWWLKLWLLSIPFTLIMMYIQPVVIDPLYNQFTELSDPKLEAQILALADRADIPADRVYEVNMSQKTNALNAYVNGIGSSLRIVLWDTTLQRLNTDEILLIMAHEMGHYVMHHLEWSAAGAVGTSFVLLWLGSLLIRWVLQRFGKAWGIRRLNEPAALPAVLLLLSVIGFFSLPLSNYVSRQAERAADQYAFELIGNTNGAVTMYQKLAASSLSEMNPPPLVALFRSTHPSLLERILSAQSFDHEKR